nr:hypothetical protein [Tanacetum cinerariifolium]
METVKFKAPPPMTGLAESQNKNKFCKFHGDKGHSTNACIHLRRQIEEAVKSRQLSHLVKEIKQGGRRGEQAKAAKKREEIEGHLIHRMYVDEGLALEVLYEYCVNKLHSKVKNKMVLATTPLRGEISWTNIANGVLRRREALNKRPDELHEAVMKLQSPQTLKEAQSLNRKLASLNRFSSKSAEKSLPFFKTLRRCVKKSDFHMTSKAKRAFQNMKTCIAELPMVTTLKPREELIIYLYAAREAVHPVVVIMDQPIKQILSQSENTRRMLKWKFELEAFNITYRPRTSIHGQILAEFIVERLDEVGAKLILTSPKGEEFTYARRFKFGTSNYEAKYKAPIAGLRIAEQMGVKNLVAKVDSRLMANQINGSYKAKEPRMIQYLEKAKSLTGNLRYSQLSRRRILLDETTHRVPCGRNPTSRHKKSRAVKIKARQYAMINGVLYRKSFLEPWLWCAGPTQAEYVVKEVPHVLWAHRTMIKISNEDTPFSLTYGTEAVIPIEILTPSLRCTEVNRGEKDEELLLNLEILEERREKAMVREAKSKAKMEKYYNARVRNTAFRPGEFVYRSNEVSNAKNSEKLGPKWEGPYEVVEAIRRGAYKHRNISGDILPLTWNVKDLKKMLPLSFHHVSTPANVKPH